MGKKEGNFIRPHLVKRREEVHGCVCFLRCIRNWFL